MEKIRQLFTVFLLFTTNSVLLAQNGGLVFPINPTYDPTQTRKKSFDLGDPSNVTPTIVYDPVSGNYVFSEKIGNSEMNYRNPSMMTLDEYLEYERQKAQQDNWKSKIDQQTAGNQPFELPIKIPGKGFKNIFGSDQITIKPQGTVELSLGVNSSRYDNPLLPVKQRKMTRFDFNQNIQMNVTGQIGTRLKLGMSYNTQAQFDFDNVTKLEYNGDEDQIIQSIALGNVSLNLPTTLIPSSKTLFGATTKLRFGKTTVDLIAASAKGQRKEITVQGGSQVQHFELNADAYEANRHYFLNLYHQQHYDEALEQLPNVNSGVMITRIEVWLTNRTNTTENTRNIIAFSDLGEGKSVNAEGNPQPFTEGDLPTNEANSLYNWAAGNPGVRSFSGAVAALSLQGAAPGPFTQALHYEKVESAKKLTDAEYTVNTQLGYISLNNSLNNDEVLAVAYEYTYRGQTYKVGELSTDGIEGSDALILKLIKPTMMNPANKIWDLMMKNVYSIGAYQVDPVGFRMDILYNNPENSLFIPFIPQPAVEDKQIVTLIGMDKLNAMGQPFSDGVMDFVPMNPNGNRFETSGTINPRNGRVYFSTVEPFGKTLKNRLMAENVPAITADRIAFLELYDSTKTAAQQIPSKNRFKFKGEFKSSVTGDIPLNALNVPEGAVKVTAGGVQLQEGVDYSVDYNLGRVRILNEGLLASNQQIKVAVESNSAFGFQSKSLIGSRISYRFNKDFNIGATWMRMMERPTTQKIDIGSEPYKNNIIGFDVQYKTELPFLTKLIDWLPVISTKEKSYLNFTGEFAHLIPGQPKAISAAGISYVDDFEGSQSTIDLSSLNAWYLASVPTGQPTLFPEATAQGLIKTSNRAKTVWYRIDNLFYRQLANTPKHILDDPTVNSDSRTRNVVYKDLFPLQENQYGQIPNLQIFELAYYPKERGMYNYDMSPYIDADGHFTNPQDRWGGIMRAMTTTDFELANIEYVQFWVLDPFNKDAEDQYPDSQMSGGDLYLNLGNISEDILPDGRKSFESGLSPTGTPTINETDTTLWAQVPNKQLVVNTFPTDSSVRRHQDVGLDGFNNEQERQHFQDYVNWIQANGTLSDDAKARMIADPSSDDYNYYLDDRYDEVKLGVLHRYKKYNGMEGNSPTPEMSANLNVGKYPTAGPRLEPDREDINQDNNLQESENYFQYKISLRKQDLQVGQNYITNKQTYTKGDNTKEDWYQFKIPVRDFERAINGISDFRSIRFMRMFMKGFDEEVLLRFAKLELVRGEWRKFTQDLTQPGEGVITDPNATSFDISAVNINENSDRQPIPYVLPPGIQREIDPSQQITRQMNEQSLSLEVCNLKDGDARAAYKNVNFDVRNYKKLKMFVHGESMVGKIPLKDDDLSVFVRFGTDFTENYYEYELPLLITPFQTTLDTDIWPEGNNVEIVFEDLINLKKRRNNLIESGNNTISLNLEFSEMDPKDARRRLKIKGSPNLNGLKSIMIGIRNPKKESNPNLDDGSAHCGIVWVNELRLTDFIDEGGSAAIAQLQIQGADFFNLAASGSYYGYNWGNVDSRVQERQREERINFNLNTNWQLGQFFGKRFGLSLPLFFGYTVGVINPEFDPYNPDIQLRDYDREEKRRRQREGQTFQERKSINFTNVRKQLAAGATPHFWRLANWSASFAFSEDLSRDFNINYDRTKVWSGNLNYNYTFQNKPWEPFKNVFKNNEKAHKSKWTAFIRDFNIGYLPKNISFTNDLLRSYNERQVKNQIVPNYEFAPVYVKRFTWNRGYNVAWDFTKSLKGTFNANNRSFFEEADGQVDRRKNPELYKEFKDSVWHQMRTFGKTMDYQHSYTLTYALPFSKIPALDWVTANVSYGGSFNWQRAPLSQPEYGNIVQNNRNINGQTQLNFVSLYNKSPFFKKVLAQGSGLKGGLAPARTTAKGAVGNTPTPAAPPKKGPTIEQRFPKPTPPKPEDEMTDKEKKKWEKEIKKWEKKVERAKKQEGKVHPVAGFGARLLMSVRNVSGTYSQNDGTILPGYNQSTSILGFNPGFNGELGGFLFGKQRFNVAGKETGYNFAEIAARNGWLVRNEDMNRQYSRTHTENIMLRAGIEPIKDVVIELTMNRQYSKNSTEFFRWNNSTQSFEGQSAVDMVNLTYTNVSIGSAFASLDKRTFSNSTFTNLLNNRLEVSKVLGGRNANSSQFGDGYFSGYNGSQQDVLIGAFLSSYTDRNVTDKGINPLRNMPLPNWSINYNGLTKFEFMKKYVRQFVIKHAYSSTISVTGMQTNMNATFDTDGNATARDMNNNFVSEYQVQNVTISERFSPLIGFDATWTVKGQGLITKFEISKDRSATLSLNNNQVTEISGTTYTVGAGYRFKNVRLPIKNLKPSDANFRLDFSLRDNVTVIRKIVEENISPTAGQKVMSLKASLDYNIGKFLIIQVYYDQTINTPKIATSFPTGNMSTGIKLRYNLAGVQ